MAQTTREYWRAVRAIASKLDPQAAERDAGEQDKENRVHLEKSDKEIWLVSKANEQTGGVDGKVVSAHPWIAARWLKDGTHAHATSEQVAKHKAELAERKEQIEKEEADRKGVPTSKLLEALVAAQTGGRKSASRE